MSVFAKSELRALKRMEAASASALPLSDRSDVYGVFAHGDRRRRPLARLSKERVDALVSSGAFARDAATGRVSLTAEGRAMVRRTTAGRQDAFRAQHMALEVLPHDEGSRDARPRLVNHAESPLAWLARRTDAAGRPLISPRELAAGERLRSDYHRGQFIGRVTSDWTAPPSGKRGRGARASELATTEAVVAARDRVAAALRDVGSGLSGVLDAACLHGRGLDDIERSFGWPPRSGKVVLRIALERLADHYGLPAD